jgi:CRISPR-associated endoribonuclease Cas6
MIKYSKITLTSDYILPYKFIGSTIRGAFGVGLKKTVCINPSGECKGCFAGNGCLFYDFFEKDTPKYRLKIFLKGEVKFELYLFEEYAEKSPYVISALFKAFKETGIGKNRQKPCFEIYYNGVSIYNGGKIKNFKNNALEFEIDEIKNRCRVVIHTPIRVKENGAYVRDKLKVETLLRTIHHKYNKLQNLPITKLPFTPEYKINSAVFSFVDLRRYSNRQKKGMNFGGVTGYIDFEYIDEKSFYMLKVGELIGVGKQTTFGLGNIQII